MSAIDGSEIGVRVFAETGELKPKMEGASSDVERSAERMKDAVARLKDDIGGHMTKISSTIKASNDDIVGSITKMSGAFTKVGGLIAGTFALIAGGKLAKYAEETADYTEEAMTLGRAMGTTATKAGIWIEVAKEVGSTTGEVEAASKGLTRQLREHEDRLNSLGLVTRDGKHKLLDMDTMMKSAIATVNSYTEGTDRNMAAQEIFGRGVAGNSKLLLANAEAFKQDEEYIRSLGGQVSGEAVAAWEIYDAAMDKTSMAMTAMRNIVGNEVMPVIAKLAEWFSSLMPAAITIVKGALGGLIATFWGLKNGVVVVWETINAMVVSVAEPIRAMAASIYKALTGDFYGAAEEIRGMGGVISDAWSTAMDEMTKSSEETSNRIADIFGAPTDVEAGDKSGKGYEGKPDKPKKEKAGPEKSLMPSWEADLAKLKANYMLEHDMYDMSLADEKAYWDKKLETLDRGDKEYGAVMKKSADLQLQILKKKASEGRAIAQEEIEEWKRSATTGVDLQQQAAEEAYALGVISKEQLLEQERSFEQERYEIAKQAVEDRIRLLENDPNMSPVEYQKLKNQLLEIDRRHALEKRKIESQISVEKMTPQMNVFKSMETSFSGAITGMLTRAQTFRQALGNVFSSIANAFVSEMVAKPAAAWAMGLIRQTALYQTFFGTKAGMEAAASGTSIATTAAESAGKIAAIAPVAAAGAASSQAAIPVVGPGLAMAAAGAMMAFVMGLGGNKGGSGTTTTTGAPINMGNGVIPSAEGGWDIPAGATGLMRFHEREMMLPAQQADAIRNMAENGGAGGNISVHLHAGAMLDSKGVENFFSKNSHTLAPAMRRMARNFTPMKS